MSIKIQIGSRLLSIATPRDLFRLIANHRPGAGVLEIKDLPDEYCQEDESTG